MARGCRSGFDKGIDTLDTDRTHSALHVRSITVKVVANLRPTASGLDGMAYAYDQFCL